MMKRRTNCCLRSACRTGLAVAGLGVIAIAGGCVGEGVDRLTAPTAEAIAPTMDQVPASAWMESAIEDAGTRVVPSLMDAEGAASIGATLAVLRSHLEAGNTNGALGATAAAQSLIDSYERKVGPDSPDAAELDAIRLALEMI